MTEINSLLYFVQFILFPEKPKNITKVISLWGQWYPELISQIMLMFPINIQEIAKHFWLSM